MAQFRISVAGYVAAVESMFESTRDYCRAYLTEALPDFSVTVNREDLAAEQNRLLEEARQEGLRPRTFPDPFLERSVIQQKLADALFERDVLMLHGSTVAVDGEAYLFTAKCGTGKSTHTRLWRQVFAERAVMVNDDKPFLRMEEAGVIACGSPWSGKHGLDTNLQVPLKGICILNRGDENRICRAAPEEVLPMLLHQCHQPPDTGKLPRLVKRLTEQIPLWSMTCNRDPQAAQTAYDAMSGK